MVTRTLLQKAAARSLVTRGQGLAIGLVIAAGVAMFVVYFSTFDSLARARQTYYDRFRFAEVFVSLKRAPLHVVEDLRALPGIARVNAPRGRRRGARYSRPGRTGDRTADLTTRARTATAERAVPPPRPAAGRRRRSDDHRGVCPRASAATRRYSDRHDQRTPARSADRRPRAVSRIHLLHPSGGNGPRQRSIWHLLDGTARVVRGVQHGRRVQRRVVCAGAAGRRCPKRLPASIESSPNMAVSEPSPEPISCRIGSSKMSSRSSARWDSSSRRFFWVCRRFC